MPGSLDSCINNIYEPGNIPASAGVTPVRVLLKDPIEAAVLEAAAAASIQELETLDVVVSEAATAGSLEDAVMLVKRSAMLPGVFVNSDGTARQAYVDGTMVNL
jgi:hypothetical protein